MFKQAAAYLGWVFYVIIMAGGVVAGGGAYHTTGDWHRALQAGAITTVALAAALLAVHAVWRLQLRDGDDERPNLRGTRFEHVNKRTLAWQLAIVPGRSPWLTAKLIALLTYIVLGHLAVRRARTRPARILLWVLALAVIAYIYAVALTASPTPGL